MEGERVEQVDTFRYQEVEFSQAGYTKRPGKKLLQWDTEV